MGEVRVLQPSGKAFTLVELLVVVALMGILLSLAVMGLQGVRNSGGIQSAVATLSGTLETARSYALAHQTYAYVGVFEADAMQPSLPETQEKGVGRLFVAVVATKDGTPGYNTYTGPSGWTMAYDGGTNLSAVVSMKVVPGIHLADLSQRTAGGMRRTVPVAPAPLTGDTAPSETPFSWPVGSSLGGGKVNFDLVLQVSPRGTVSFLQGADGPPPTAIEIGLQPCHGNTVPPSSDKGDCAAVQIDGINGSVTVYQP
ncbi:MAG TPA: prepilin-type N-terminal cleavage/methylation domain-containing protein [Candidatus Methylacidiphilales bacterium]